MAFYATPPAADSPFVAPPPCYTVNLRGVDVRPWTAADRAECGAAVDEVGITIAPRYTRRRMTYILFVGGESLEAAEAWACAIRVGALLSSASPTLCMRGGGAAEGKNGAVGWRDVSTTARSSSDRGDGRRHRAAGGRRGGSSAPIDVSGAECAVALMCGVAAGPDDDDSFDGDDGDHMRGSGSRLYDDDEDSGSTAESDSVGPGDDDSDAEAATGHRNKSRGDRSKPTNGVRGGVRTGSVPQKALSARPPACLETAAFTAAWFWLRILRPTGAGCPWIPFTGLAVRIPLGGMARVSEHLLDGPPPAAADPTAATGASKPLPSASGTAKGDRPRGSDFGDLTDTSNMDSGVSEGGDSPRVARPAHGSRGQRGGPPDPSTKRRSAVSFDDDDDGLSASDRRAVEAATAMLADDPEADIVATFTRSYGHGRQGRSLKQLVTNGAADAHSDRLLNAATSRHWGVSQSAIKELAVSCVLRAANDKRRKRLKIDPRFGHRSIDRGVVAAGPPAGGETTLCGHLVGMVCDVISETLLGVNSVIVPANNSDSDEDLHVGDRLRVVLEGSKATAVKQDKASPPTSPTTSNPAGRGRGSSSPTRAGGRSVSVRSFGAAASAQAMVGVNGATGPVRAKSFYRINDVHRATIRISRAGRAATERNAPGTTLETLDGSYDLESPWAGGPGAPPDGFTQDAMRLYAPLGAAEHYARRMIDRSVSDAAMMTVAPRLAAMSVAGESVFAHAARDAAASGAPTQHPAGTLYAGASSTCTVDGTMLPIPPSYLPPGAAAGADRRGREAKSHVYHDDLVRPAAALRRAVGTLMRPLITTAASPIANLVTSVVPALVEVFRVVLDVTIPSAAASGYGPMPAVGGEVRRPVSGMVGTERNRAAVTSSAYGAGGKADAEAAAASWRAAAPPHQRALWGRYCLASDAASVDEPRGLDDYSLVGWLALPDALLPIDCALTAFADVAWAVQDQLVLARRVTHVSATKAPPTSRRDSVSVRDRASSSSATSFITGLATGSTGANSPPGTTDSSARLPAGIAATLRPPWLRLPPEAGAPDPLRVECFIDSVGEAALRLIMSTVEAADRLVVDGMTNDDAWIAAVAAATAEAVETITDICMTMVEESTIRQLVLAAHWTTAGHETSKTPQRAIDLGEAVERYMFNLSPSLVGYCDPRFEVAFGVQEELASVASKIIQPCVQAAIGHLGRCATEPLTFRRDRTRYPCRYGSPDRNLRPSGGADPHARWRSVDDDTAAGTSPTAKALPGRVLDDDNDDPVASRSRFTYDATMYGASFFEKSANAVDLATAGNDKAGAGRGGVDGTSEADVETTTDGADARGDSLGARGGGKGPSPLRRSAQMGRERELEGIAMVRLAQPRAPPRTVGVPVAAGRLASPGTALRGSGTSATRPTVGGGLTSPTAQSPSLPTSPAFAVAVAAAAHAKTQPSTAPVPKFGTSRPLRFGGGGS